MLNVMVPPILQINVATRVLPEWVEAVLNSLKEVRILVYMASAMRARCVNLLRYIFLHSMCKSVLPEAPKFGMGVRPYTRLEYF